MKSKKFKLSTIVFYSVFIAIALVLPNMAFATPVPDTGQTKCYDSSQEIPCPQPGEPYYGQDAQYIINPPSYTKLDANGNDLPDSAATWAMVRDNVTGLIWEMKTNYDGIPNYSDIHDADVGYTWYDSNPVTNGGNAGTPGNGTDTDDFINTLNNAHFGNFSDWRLPAAKEWGTITNHSDIYSIPINLNFFPNTNPTLYWTSNTVVQNNSVAWIVSFTPHAGYIYDGGLKAGTLAVRAVRGIKPSNNFRDNDPRDF